MNIEKSKKLSKTKTIMIEKRESKNGFASISKLRKLSCRTPNVTNKKYQKISVSGVTCTWYY